MEIFTTGAYLYPIEGADGRFYWAVGGFEDDSFMDGDIFNPLESADKLEDLLKDRSEQ
jgi:hypothetical protein